MLRMLLNFWFRPLMLTFADVGGPSSYGVLASDANPVVPDLSGFDIASLQDPFTPSLSSLNSGNFLAVSDSTGSTAIPNSPTVQPAPSTPGWQTFASSLLGSATKAYTDSLPSIAHPVTPVGKLPSSAIPAISRGGIGTAAVVGIAALAAILGLAFIAKKG